MTSVTTSLDLVSLKMLFLLIHFESTLVFHFFTLKDNYMISL